MRLPALLLGLALASPAQAFFPSHEVPFHRLPPSPGHMGAPHLPPGSGFAFGFGYQQGHRGAPHAWGVPPHGFQAPSVILRPVPHHRAPQVLCRPVLRQDRFGTLFETEHCTALR